MTVRGRFFRTTSNMKQPKVRQGMAADDNEYALLMIAISFCQNAVLFSPRQPMYRKFLRSWHLREGFK